MTELDGGVQVALGDVTLGEVDASTGVRWRLSGLDGWAPAPSSGRVQQRTYAHGGWASRAWYAPRTIVLKGIIIAPTAAGLVTAFDLLSGSIPVDELAALTVTEPGGVSRYCMVRQSGEPFYSYVTDTIGRYDVQLVAPDPRRLSAALRTASTGLASSSGGLSWPVSWPITWGATVTGGSVTVVNGGNVTAPCTVRFTGPVPTPRLYHVGQGRELTLSFEVLSGQYVDVNLDTRSVLLNGTVSRKGLVSGRWPTIEPGSNVLRFAAASYEASALMTASWRDAYR